MRLHTLVFSAALLAFVSLPLVGDKAHAQAAASSSQRFTNADLLALPERDQRIWLNGAVEGLAGSIYLTNRTAGRCVLDWYTSGGRLASFQAQARTHMNERPMTVLLAMTNRQCNFYSTR